MAINIDLVTSHGLRRGDLRQILPEYYALETVVEYNGAHHEPNVLDHVIRVYKALENVVKLEFLNGDIRNKIQKHLEQKIGKLTHKQLLFIVALLHDIGKKDTLFKNPDGTTGCPWHELVMFTHMPQFKDRFEWEEADYHWVEKSVLYHQFVHTEVENFMNTDDQQYVSLMERILGKLLVDLLLFTYADTIGSDLKILDADRFKKKETAIIQLLKVV